MKVEWISTKERQPEKGRAIWRYIPNAIHTVDLYARGAGEFLTCGVTHWAYADLPEKPEPPKPKELWVAKFTNGEFSGYCYDSQKDCANHITNCTNNSGSIPVLFKEALS